MSSKSDDSASPYAGLASKIRDGKSAALADYEATPPKLLVTYRKSGATGRGLVRALSAATTALRNPPLRVELDGVIVGSIPAGATLQLETTAGSHRLRILSTLCSTAREFEVTNGQRVRYWCLVSTFGIVLQKDS